MCGSDLQGLEKCRIFAMSNYYFMSHSLYKNIRGKVITDFYSEYDLNTLGFSLLDFSVSPSWFDNYERACSLYNDAETIGDKDLMEAAEALILEMQRKEGYGQE